jgi:hypothetical protein
MTVDTNTGDALCDDGTHGNVGAAYSACPAVQQLIVHVCANSDPAVACP